MWERPNGSTDDFVEMIDLSDQGGLPSEPQGTTLRFWEWRADGIYMLGATQDTQVRLRYRKAFADLVDGTSPVLIRNAQEVLAFSPRPWPRPRGPRRPRALGRQPKRDALEDLVARATQREQYG